MTAEPATQQHMMTMSSSLHIKDPGALRTHEALTTCNCTQQCDVSFRTFMICNTVCRSMLLMVLQAVQAFPP